MARTYTAAEVADEATCPEERVHWMTSIGLLTPDENGRFTFGAVLSVKMAIALLATSVPAESIERAAAEGLLKFQRTDEYLPYQPGPLSSRTFAEFQASAGPRARLLPAIFEVLGLPKPDPNAPIHADEEALFERFLEAWAMAPDEDALIRAARLMAAGTRAATGGWMDLQDEQVAEPARERLLRGELEEFPDDVRVGFTKVTRLAPDMFLWLSARYLEQRSVSGIVEGFERYLATRGLAPIPEPPSPPAIVFVDLSGFTRLTRERGDESAVVAATSLQRHADAVATRLGGRLVKLLGDGAMLRLADAAVGVEAAFDLVSTMSSEGAPSPHAGVHSGPVIERDLDVFGQTVNLASRIADVAGPGEVLASEAVVEAAGKVIFGFERIQDARLQGFPDPIPLYRVVRAGP
ncbi:MAG: adenylate/guanylate cyclase domain-containing protein [Actinobacteria bacterium]|nr:MAG: adenylate/guanylate cyclase domain-containing protein [Actinomycetota bacterium]